MYYPPGWKITVDNNPVEKIYKTNHALQSIVIPAGKHMVHLSFDPDSYKYFINVSYASAGILYIIVILSLIMMFKDKFPGMLKRPNDSSFEV